MTSKEKDRWIGSLVGILIAQRDRNKRLLERQKIRIEKSLTPAGDWFRWLNERLLLFDRLKNKV